MYACLFGEYPVSATKDHVSMANKVLNHKFHFPSNGLDKKFGVKDLLYGLLEKNPNQRLCSLDELRQSSFMSNINFDRIYSKFFSPINILIDPKYQWYDELRLHYHSSETQNPYENIDHSRLFN